MKTMKTLQAALAAAVIGLATVVAAPVAHAGYWAATVVDPLPDRIEPDRTYTVGYWVMQHASHPYDGDFGKLGTTALKLVGENGKEYTFEGVPLGQTSHYAAAVSVPHSGTWELHTIQGRFEPYKIGTLTVPGGLDVRPLPPPVCSQQHEPEWGLVRPPDLNRCDGSGRIHASDSQGLDQRAIASGGDSDRPGDASGAARTGASLPNTLWALLALPLLAGGVVLAWRRPAFFARSRGGGKALGGS